MPVTPEAALCRSLDAAFGEKPPRRIGVAVSGGGDSVALLHLSQGWCAAREVSLLAATVDHGLRAEAAGEAAGVARACSALGVAHVTLNWQGWDGRGNLQDVARQGRRALLAGWAEGTDGEGLDAVLLGHTSDDQAETLLMRLARGSGVDGLCGMEAVDRRGVFLRPLLDVSREALRCWLRARDIGWVEDPSNDDLRFDRIKARRLLGELGALGLTPARLTETARHMQRARTTLRQAATDWVAAHVRAEAGDLLCDADTLDLNHSDTQGRVLAAAIQWIGNAVYRPRLDALRDLACALRRGEARTLGGARLQPDGRGGARLSRELAAAAGPMAVKADPGSETAWDGRWLVSRMGPNDAALGHPQMIAALGERGLAACPEWRNTGLPRHTLLASPAIWQHDRVIAAPLAGFSGGWHARLHLPFDRFIVSH